MILNMGGGRANVQYIYFTLTNRIDYPDKLTIQNVHIPGGVVKGFAIFQDNPTEYALFNKAIVYAYSNEEQAKTKSVYGYYISTGINRVLFSNFGFEYDEDNQTLTILPNLTEYFWREGRYCLFVW